MLGHMGFRMRKSFKVMPGVRMTVTPRGVSTSVGTRGARVTVHSSGRTTTTLGIPGTGVSYVQTSGGQRGRPAKEETLGSVADRAESTAAHRAPQVVPKASFPRPSLFAPKWEKALYTAYTTRQFDSLEDLARKYPEARMACMILDGLNYEGPDQVARVGPIFEELWGSGFDPTVDSFLHKYLPTAVVTVGIAPGIEARMPLSRDAVGLMLAEFRQANGDVAGASDVVERLEPSVVAAVSLAELYSEQARWHDIVQMTDGISGDDDFTAYLLTQRGIALRHLGDNKAAADAFTTSLSRHTQPVGLRHRTLTERALVYEAGEQHALARRDLESILANDPAHYEAQTILARIPDRTEARSNPSLGTPASHDRQTPEPIRASPAATPVVPPSSEFTPAHDLLRRRHDGGPSLYVSDEGPADRFVGKNGGLPPLYLTHFTQDGEDILRLVEAPTGLMLSPKNRKLARAGVYCGYARGLEYHSAQAKAADLTPGAVIRLVREPNNPHDSNAVAITSADSNEVVAYVNKAKARSLAKLMDAGLVLEGISLRGTKAGQSCERFAYLAARPDVLVHLMSGRPRGCPPPVFSLED